MTQERFIYAGEVVDKSKKIKHSEGKVLLNLMVSVTQEIYGGIKDEVSKKVLLFQRQADKGFKEISRGDYVLFSACKRSPRDYTTTKGTYVEELDIIADRFTVLTAEQWEANAEQFSADMPSLASLEFNEKDREELAIRKAKAKEKEKNREEAALKAASEAVI